MRGRYPALFGALLLSLLLHGVVLDLGRLGDLAPAEDARVQLRGHLAPTPPSSGTALPAPRDARLEISPPPVKAGEQISDAPPAITERAGDAGGEGSQARAARRGETGFFARDTQEGLIAYRLNLALALSPPGVDLPAALKLGLAVGVEGTPGEPAVLQSSGDAARDAQWVEWLRRASHRAAVPDSLAGRAFELELHFE